jgi:hypothetical protein
MMVESPQPEFARVPVWLLLRPDTGVQLSGRNGDALPEVMPNRDLFFG